MQARIDRWRSVERLERTLCAVCLTLGLGKQAFPQCRAPGYREGFTLADSNLELVTNISVRLQDFAPDKLICLVSSFKARHPGKKSIVLNIFSSSYAAKNSVGVIPPEYTKEALDMLKELHADYFLSVDRKEEYVEIRPFGLRPGLSAYDTRINLPTAEKPHCRLELDGRCVLALEPIFYPADALKGKVSGAVTLTGTIAGTGKVSNTSVTEISVEPTGRKDVLVNAALENLKTWQVEASSRLDRIRITYSFQLVAPGIRTGQPDLQFDLPSKITIRGKLE